MCSGMQSFILLQTLKISPVVEMTSGCHSGQREESLRCLIVLRFTGCLCFVVPEQCNAGYRQTSWLAFSMPFDCVLESDIFNQLLNIKTN